jgi:hypothetical protein
MQEKQEEHFFLTKDKLTNMVREAFNAKKVHMINYKVAPAVAKGDNFMGEVSRCDMVIRLDNAVESKELNWIVKTLPEKPGLFSKPLMRVMKLEEKEIEIYKKVRALHYLNTFERRREDDVLI